MRDPAVAEALDAIRREHARDPRVAAGGGEGTVSEAYHAAVERWLGHLVSDPSPALALAAAAAHLRRHEVPRGRFPPGRAGYLAYRAAAAEHQARCLAAVLAQVGVDPAVAEYACNLVARRAPAGDASAQALEDAVCLAFFERDAVGFARRHPPGKVRRVVAKTLAKMSPPARRIAARNAALPDAVRALVRRAAAPGFIP